MTHQRDSARRSKKSGRDNSYCSYMYMLTKEKNCNGERGRKGQLALSNYNLVSNTGDK